MMQWFHSLSTWLEANPHGLAWVIFAVATLECLALAGIFTPGVLMLFALGVLAGNGALDLWQTIALAFAGGLLGDAISYGLGRYFQQGIARLPVLRNHPQWIGHAERYFNRYGAISLIVGRFIGPLRPMLPMTAGMLNMPVLRFALISIVAAAGWAMAYTLPGWATGAAIRLPLPDGFWEQAAVLAGALGVLVLLISHTSLAEKRWSSLLAAGLTALAAGALLLTYPRFASVDQGIISLLQGARDHTLDQWAMAVTVFGDRSVRVAAFVLLVGILLIMRRWQAAIFCALSMSLAALATVVIKAVLQRPRPDVLSVPLESYSLPSGHTTAAVAFFLSLGILAGRGSAGRTRLAWISVTCLPALLVAFTRPYLGVHWPTDILAGSLIGASACAVSLFLCQYRTPMAALGLRTWALVVVSNVVLFALSVFWRMPHALELYRY